MITIATFSNYLEANIAADYLRQSGVECFLADENFSRIYGATGVTAIRIMVAEKDAAAALVTLQEIQNQKT